MEESITGTYLIIAILALVLAVLWILLPFAVFGIKGRLDQMLVQSKKISHQLEQLTGKPAPEISDEDDAVKDGWL